MGKKLTLIDLSDNQTLEEVFEEFVTFKVASGMAQSTIDLYNYEYSHFRRYTSNTTDIRKLKAELLRLFSDRSKLAPTTYNMTYKVFNCFFNWAEHEKLIEVNPIKELGLKAKRDEGKLRSIPNDKIKSMLQVIDIKQYVEFRDYVIILLMLDTGIRPVEAFRLELDNIDLEHYSIVVTKEKAKTRTQRQLPVSKLVIDLIHKLLKLRPDDWELNWVFNNHEGGKMHTQMFTRRLFEYSIRCGSKITPYDLRHSFATKFIENEGNIFVLQNMMGHSDLRMTKRYVTISQEKMQEQHTKASPLNNIIQRNTRVVKLFK